MSTQSGQRPPTVLVNCDDLGYHPTINEAILEILEQGTINEASLMATGPGFADAVDGLRRLGRDRIGAHLVLAAEYPNLPMRPVCAPSAVPSLVTDHGVLHRQLTVARQVVDLDELRREVNAQLARIESCGFAISHVDGHMLWYEEHVSRRAMHDLVADICERRQLPLRSSTPHASRAVEDVVMLWDDFEDVPQRLSDYDDLFASPWEKTRELIIHPARDLDALRSFCSTGERRIADYLYFRDRDKLAHLERSGIVFARRG